MEGLRQQFDAKLGPLPVWAWALLAVLAVLGWMYFTKSGLFAPPAATSGSDNSGDNSGLGDAGLPVGLGGLAGAGNPGAVPTAANPVSAYYDPGTGGYVGSSFSSDGNISSSPNIDLSGAPSSFVANLGAGAPGFRDTPQSVSQPTGVAGIGQTLLNIFRSPQTSAGSTSVPTSSGRTGAQSF